MKRIILSSLLLSVSIVALPQRIAVLSDIHVTPGTERQAELIKAIDEINSDVYDLVIVDGDLTNEGSDVELRNVKSYLDNIRHPLYVIPGNHENNWSQSATKTFTDLWGNDRFVTKLDSLLIVGINCGPYMKMGDGHIKQEDLHWLQNTLNEQLKPGMKVLSFNHYPIRKDDIDNYREYSDLLQQYPVIAHINGHYHSWDTYCIGKVPAVMVRALEMGKNHDNFGYTILTVNDGQIRVDEKKTGSEPSLKYMVSDTGDCTPSSSDDVVIYSATRPVWTDSASVFTRLSFDNGNVYFGTSTGMAKAVDKKTGQLVWQWQVPSKAPVYSRSTLTDNSRIAVPHATGISILDTKTGKPLGEYPSKEGPYVADGITNGDRYIQGGYKRIECRDNKTGALIWSYDSINNYCQAAPAVSGDDLIFGAWDTYLRCLDSNTGVLKWRWSNGTSNNMTGPGNVVPVVTDDKVIIVAPDRYMTAIDRKTGQQIWRDKSYRYRESLGHSEDMSKAYAKTMDGEIVAVSTEGNDFNIIWVSDMGIGYEHAPCVVAEVDGVVYAGSRRGIITALNAADGSIIWQRQYGTSEINGIDIDPTDGSVWASLIEGKIIRLSPDKPRDIIILDSHADTPLDLIKGVQLGDYNPNIQVSIPRLKQGGVGAQYLACWVKQEGLNAQGRKKAKARIDQLIDCAVSQIAKNDSICGLAVSADDVYRLNDEGKIAFLLGVENGYGIGHDLNVIDEYKDKGVTYITLCHSKNNDICDSSSDKGGPRWHGLSPFGKQVVSRMDSLGILIDLSHASEETFWNVIKISKNPVVCTHSSSSAVYRHNRNLTDAQLKALAENGGVVQVCAVDDFLYNKSRRKPNIDDFMKHFNHIISIVGVDHIGIGTDFDGGGGVPGFNGSEDFVNVKAKLKEAGYSDDDLTKILGGNFLRVLSQVQAQQ